MEEFGEFGGHITYFKYLGNMYAYAGANPINLIDPLGLVPGFCRLEDRDVWMQDDSIKPLPIWEDPIFDIALIGVSAWKSWQSGWRIGGHWWKAHASGPSV